MKQEELTDLLRALPREEASAGFTARVKARVREPRRRPTWNFAVASSVAALLVIGTVGTIEFAEHRQEERRLVQMNAEKEQIRKELDQLRELADDGESRVVLGSTGNYDLVMDVSSNKKKVSSTNLPVVIVSDDGAL